MGIVHAKEALVGEKLADTNWQPFNKVPARVDKIHFDGVQRTKDDVFLYVIRDLLQVETFQELVLGAHVVRQQLESLNAFNRVDIILDTSSGKDSSPNGYEITFDIKEKSRLAGNISALVGNNDGSVLLKFLMPNLFGRTESAQAEYQYGGKTSGFNFLMVKPIFGWVDPTTIQSVFSHVSDCPWSGYKEEVKGIATEISFESSPQVLHNLKLEGAWRNLKCAYASPFEIREEAGHSLKCSIKHVLSMDQRDSPCLPTRGCFFRLYQEYAGLGGDVRFLKHEVQYQVNKSFFEDFVLQGTFMGGFLHSLDSNKTVRINDKFFLGGPLSLRGFQMHGVGPHAQSCSTGGETYWAAGLHAYAPLPFKPLSRLLHKVCHTHIFLNAGNIGNFSFTDDYHKNMMLLLSQIRWSCGAGLAVAVGGIARFEINYCIPLTSAPGDRATSGLQFGIGMNFL